MNPFERPIPPESWADNIDIIGTDSVHIHGCEHRQIITTSIKFEIEERNVPSLDNIPDDYWGSVNLPLRWLTYVLLTLVASEKFARIDYVAPETLEWFNSTVPNFCKIDGRYGNVISLSDIEELIYKWILRPNSRVTRTLL